MKIILNGEAVEAGETRGPAGPDGNPIGTIISYMGLTAPKNYLVCDGAEYDISKYPELARFFEAQFGSANHFGGDGTATFAVPDLRNLFLRGYHGAATEKLSGNIGERQEATNLPTYGIGNAGNVNFVTDSLTEETWPSYHDKKVGNAPIGRYVEQSAINSWSTTLSGFPKTYTTRPINAAVLYCIKAVTSVPAENVYSTEEQVVGRWIDGKPLYRKAIVTTLKSAQDGWQKIADAIPNLNILTHLSGCISRLDGVTQPLSLTTGDTTAMGILYTKGNYTNLPFAGFGVCLRLSTFDGGTIVIFVEYTKTTD